MPKTYHIRTSAIKRHGPASTTSLGAAPRSFDAADIANRANCKEPRVLIVSLSKRFGGVDVRVLQTTREYFRRGLPVRVAALAGSQLHQELQRQGLPVEPIARGRADPRIAMDLVRIAREMDANVIDAQNMQSQYWAAVASLGLRSAARIATVHSIYRDEHPRPGPREMREGALWLTRFMGFRFVAVSTQVQKYLTSTIGISRDRVFLSWNGLEALNDTAASFDLAKETGWPSDAFVLGIVGRLEQVKGHRILFDALRILVERGDLRCRLLVVGSGRDGAALERAVLRRGLGRFVHFTGFRSDVTAILPTLDVLCLPSLSEGLPFCVLEACRQGVPVLATELDGMTDLFVDEETIFFTPSGDPKKLSERLAQLVDDPGRLTRVGLAAQHFVKTDLSIEAMINTTLNAYSDEGQV